MKIFAILSSLILLVSSCSVAQTTISKTPFQLNGKTYIKTATATVNGQQVITLNFDELGLPVSTATKAAIALKADKTAVDLKADKTAVTTLVAAKADKTAVDLKADKTALDLKADKSAVTASLSSKADKTTVDAKADISALDGKADKTALTALQAVVSSNAAAQAQINAQFTTQIADIQKKIDAALVSVSARPAPTIDTATVSRLQSLADVVTKVQSGISSLGVKTDTTVASILKTLAAKEDKIPFTYLGITRSGAGDTTHPLNFVIPKLSKYAITNLTDPDIILVYQTDGIAGFYGKINGVWTPIKQ